MKRAVRTPSSQSSRASHLFSMVGRPPLTWITAEDVSLVVRLTALQDG